jgi:hypothetical protein
MAKQVTVEIEVNSSQVDKTVQKLGQLKDLGRGLKIQYDIDGKPIDVAIDKSLNLQKQVKILTAELRRTKEGTAEFQLLSTKLGDAQDQLAKTTAKSKDLFTSLSMIPGPIGQFFSQLQGGIELLKTFSSFTFKDLSFQFKETANDIADIGKNLGGIDSNVIDDVSKSTDNLGDSFKSTATTAGSLTNAIQSSQDKWVNYDKAVGDLQKSTGALITQYPKMINGVEVMTDAIRMSDGSIRSLSQSELLAINSGKALTITTEGLVVAEKAATFWTTTLGTTIKTVLISTGVLAAIVVIGELVAMLYRYVSGTEDAEAATRGLTGALEEQQRVLQNDLDAIDMANKANITRAKIAGKTEEEINKIAIQGGQERLDALREYDKQLFNDQQLLTKNTKISAEDREKLSKDINDKILKNGQDITKQILGNEQLRLDEQLRVAEKGREDSKKIQEKKVDDTKVANDMLLELNKNNALASISDERKRQYRELELQAATEVDKVNALKVSEEKKGELRNQIFLKYSKKQIDLKNKFDEEDLKKIQEQGQKVADYASKLEEIRIAAIEDANLKEEEQRRNKFSNDIKDLDKALKDKLLSQEQYNTAVINLQKGLDNDIIKINDDKKKKEKDDNLKKLDDDLKFLQITNEANKNSFGAYWKGREELLMKAKERELSEVEAGSDKALAIEKKYATLSKQLQQEKYQAILGYVGQGLSAASNIIAQSQQVSQLAMQNELDAVKGSAEEQDKIKEKYFEKNKKTQIAQAIISTLQSAISAFSSLAVIPVVGPALGAAAAAAALIFGYKQVDQIKKQQYQSSTAGGDAAEAAKPAMANYGRSYESGGMIGGKRHAEGGTMIEAERGEAIMTRGAVTMFAPMLSMMNQMGGGTSFAPSLTTTSYDKPNVTTPSQDQAPIIVKSYVVSNELTSEQNKQARLKDLSTL